MTLESKTNFLRGSTVGERVKGECDPPQRGRSTSVWQTRISDEQGGLAPVVTHTQLVVVLPEGT